MDISDAALIQAATEVARAYQVILTVTSATYEDAMKLERAIARLSNIVNARDEARRDSGH